MDDLTCNICDKFYKNKRQLARHKRLQHKIRKDGVINCNDCERSFVSLQKYREHLHDDHGINFCVEEKLQFCNREEFNKWLAEEELKTCSHFIVPRGERKSKTFSTVYYVCNRSGFFKPKSNRRRQLKSQGTAKIGYFCTADIRLKIFSTHVEAVYNKDHYKHKQSVCHIPLPTEDKQVIAGKLMQGVDERRILKDIRLSVPADPQRIHLTTRKDIFNIKRDFGITLNSKGSVLSSDSTSVDMWVNNQAKTESNPVLFYKAQGESTPNTDPKDFILILMTPFQKKILSNYGWDRICVDSTHGISGYDFELTTVMVIDRFEEGIPVAFCISSTVNTQILTKFFTCVKDVEPDIKAQVFMSDDAPMFYNAWESTFGPVSSRLLCAWHVDKAWRGHLNTVKGEKRNNVYKALKTLLYELEESTFQQMLDTFLQELRDDEDTQIFYNYFVKYYSSRVTTWAYCFRKYAKLNTNMHMENFHRSLKHIYLNGKKTKRLDKTIDELMNLVTDKHVDNILKSYKGKITKKATVNFKRHADAEILIRPYEKVSENTWRMDSATPNKAHEISKIHTCDNTCIIACRICVCCADAYKCTCFDNTISNVMCKHIHFIVMSENRTQTYYTGPLNRETCNSNNEMSEFVESMETQTSAPQTSANISSTLSVESLMKRHNSIYAKLATMKDISPNISKQLLELYNAMDHLLDMNPHDSVVAEDSPSFTEPANKRLTPQARFFSVKKKRPRKKLKLSKPSQEETQDLRNILLGTCVDKLIDHDYL